MKSGICRTRFQWRSRIVTDEFAVESALCADSSSRRLDTTPNKPLVRVTSAREHCPINSENIYDRAGEWRFCLVTMSTTYKIVEGTIVLVFALGAIGWGFFRMLKRSDDPTKVIFKWVITLPLAVYGLFFASNLGPLGPPVMAVFGIIMAIMWGPHICAMAAKPFTALYDGGNEEPEQKPYYSIARSLRMKGKYLEAVVEVRKQLARFPNDFEGVMLLAGIQAENLQDLPGADITLNHFCDRPEAPPKQFAAAMNQLADWQLKLTQDADSARGTLEKIVTRFPDTELALLAAQRVAHLGGAEKILLAAHDRQPLAVPEGAKNVGLLESSEHLRPAEIDPAKLAADYVKHLTEHPLDTEVREKLAILYADHYQRLDLAAGELEQLIEVPNQPPKRVAHWLNLLADLQIRHGADYDTVRGTLERIVERFPDWAVAELARTRLGRLKLEVKAHQATPDVKLGVYEQNIGLKYGTRRRL
jgi:tetratricopeptide (TPR) repeat protein